MNSDNPLPAFYDIEASGLDGVPIEVGWAFIGEIGEIVSSASLIKPPHDWHIEDYWDEAAEELHGISRVTLENEGRSPFAICRAMNAALAGRELYADSTLDEPWLRLLFDAAGLEPVFTVRRMLAPALFAKECQMRGISHTLFNALQNRADAIAPRTHRAEADARHLAVLYQLVVKHTLQTR